jgi:hypothetical protein
MKKLNFLIKNTPLAWTALVALVLSLTLLVGQHWGMMLSNSDDPWIIRATWEMNLKAASDQGRFWLILINTMAALPYQLGSWEAANTIKMLVNAAVFVAFLAFCIRLTSSTCGMLMGMVWLALIDVSPGYYSPFHGYLMMFNLQFVALFISFYWYLYILDGDEPTQTVVGPYLLFAFALLAYEPMLFYSGVFPALFLYRRANTTSGRWEWRLWLQLLRNFLQSNLLLPVVVLAYILSYFVYRAYQPRPGRSIDTDGTVVDVLVATYRLSVQGFHVEFSPLTNYMNGNTVTPILIMAVLYALGVAAATLTLLPKIRGEQYPIILSNKLSVVVLVFYVLIPNFLLGMTAGYRQLAAEGVHYLGSYFSSFPLAMVVALGIISLVGGPKATQEKVLFVVVVAVLATSACDNYLRWGDLAQRNRTDSQLWFDAIADLRNQKLDASKQTVLCGLHAPEKVSGDERYWSGYLTDMLGKPIHYFYKNLATIQCDIQLDFNKYRSATK